MNLRQKAKHFKRLYEDMLNEPCKVIRMPYRNLRHYKASKMAYPADMCDFPEDLFEKSCIYPEILRQFKDVMTKNIEVEDYVNRKVYSLDVWLRE